MDNDTYKVVNKQRRDYFVISAVMCVAVVVFIGLFDGFSLPLVLGALLGLIASFIRFYMIGSSIIKLIQQQKDSASAQLSAKGGYYLRMLVIAAAVIISIKVPLFDWVGCCVVLCLTVTFTPLVMKWFIKDYTIKPQNEQE